MSISTFFGSRVVVVPNTSVSSSSVKLVSSKGVIECSSRPQKKGTAHHMKTRPKKTQPWDIKRRPTVYDPLPPLPPDWTLVTASSTSDGEVAAEGAPYSPEPTESSG